MSTISTVDVLLDNVDEAVVAIALFPGLTNMAKSKNGQPVALPDPTVVVRRDPHYNADDVIADAIRA